MRCRCADPQGLSEARTQLNDHWLIDTASVGPYLAEMLRVPPPPPRSGFIEPCLPSAADRPPSGPDWVHEIKHDGFRLMARRDSVGIRLLTRNGHDWADRYPAMRRSRACCAAGGYGSTSI